MDIMTINRLIKGLGQPYGKLLAEGVIPGLMLQPLFKSGENLHLIQQPESGVELWFGSETEDLERIILSLTAVIEGEAIYTGYLPSPFTHVMNQQSIHVILGVPGDSMGPKRFPPPIGMTGGWDAYRLEATIHPSAKVVAQYSPDKSVNTLIFTLIDKKNN